MIMLSDLFFSQQYAAIAHEAEAIMDMLDALHRFERQVNCDRWSATYTVSRR